MQSIAEVSHFGTINFHTVLLCFGLVVSTPFELLHTIPNSLQALWEPQNFTIDKNISSFCGHVQFGEVSKPAE